MEPSKGGSGFKRFETLPEEIELGMELHKNSVVCDAYGFASRAIVDNDAMRTAIEIGASNVEL